MPFRVLIFKQARYYLIVTEVGPQCRSCICLFFVFPYFCSLADGRDDVVVATMDGEIVFLHQNGTPLYGETLKVPELRVKKDWFEGIDGADITASLTLHNQHDGVLGAVTGYEDSAPSGRKLLSVDGIPVCLPTAFHITYRAQCRKLFLSEMQYGKG